MASYCNKRHPTLRFRDGVLLRCDSPVNHEGDHFNSFAMRKWENKNENRQDSKTKDLSVS